MGLRIVVGFVKPLGVIQMMCVDVSERFLRFTPQIGIAFVQRQGDGAKLFICENNTTIKIWKYGKTFMDVLRDE